MILFTEKGQKIQHIMKMLLNLLFQKRCGLIAKFREKNSRSYQRTLTYLYLQKLKCPKCNRILGGKATTKKNGKTYFYYYCNDCKIQFKENVINEYFEQFIDELTEYDSVVNQFFLPMIKQKFDEPKEQLEKEINNQKSKLERIKKAYINGAFELKEYNEEKHIVEKTIVELEEKLNITDCTEKLKFTPKDILLKRDINFINKIKLDKEYQEKTKAWKDYTREEKADLIMRYVEYIENTSKDIDKILDSLKPAKLKKNNMLISNEDVKKIKEYYKDVKDITNTIRSVNDLNIAIKNFEHSSFEISKENHSLKYQLEQKDNKIDYLKDELSTKEKIINKLQTEKEKIKLDLQKFKNFWHSLMSHFHKRICYENDKNYKIVSDDLYKNGIFDDNDNEIADSIYRKVIIPDESKANKNKRRDIN